MQVAVLGLGKMGSQSRAAPRRGPQLCVWNRTAGQAAPSPRAQVLSTPGRLEGGSLGTMVLDDRTADVTDELFSPG